VWVGRSVELVVRKLHQRFTDRVMACAVDRGCAPLEGPMAIPSIRVTRAERRPGGSPGLTASSSPSSPAPPELAMDRHGRSHVLVGTACIVYYDRDGDCDGTNDHCSSPIPSSGRNNNRTGPCGPSWKTTTRRASIAPLLRCSIWRPFTRHSTSNRVTQCGLRRRGGSTSGRTV
jgi:hypothetical protein